MAARNAGISGGSALHRARRAVGIGRLLAGTRSRALTHFVRPATLANKGSLIANTHQRKTGSHPQGSSRVRHPEDHFGGQGLRRGHVEAAERYGILDSGGHAVSVAEQAATGTARRLRVEGIRRRPASQVLQADGAGPHATRGPERLLERTESNPGPTREVAMQKVVSINL